MRCPSSATAAACLSASWLPPATRTATFPLPLGGRLFLYSDGASELWTGEDTVLGEEGLLEIVQRQMRQPDDSRFLDEVLDSLATLVASTTM